jgi:hypothetical protein
MAALFPKIYDVIDLNPNKHATLRWCEPTSTQGSKEELWDIFQVKPLSPPGALSILLTITEPMYELGTIPLRKQLLTEHLLTLHTRVDNELVGRRFPRRKIQDLLAAEVSAQSPSGSALLEEVLCELFGVQKVHFQRKSKKITFYPPDLRLWRSDKPIIFAEEDNTWMFTPTQHLRFLDWLLAKEDEGWSLSWPTADGKLEEIKSKLLSHQVVLQAPAGSTKLKKEDLAKALGRVEAIKVLRDLRLSIDPVKLEVP